MAAKDHASLLSDQIFLKYNSSAALANFVQPIFTLFLPSLAFSLKANVLELGVLGGASSLVYCFMPFVMGRFSDRGQVRKFMIALSLAVLASASILYYFAANPIMLILLRVFEGLGWAAFWPSIDSAVSHDTRVDPRKALSVFNLTWSATAALGPLIGSFVVVYFSTRPVFIFNSVFLIAALALNLVPLVQSRMNSESYDTKLVPASPHNSEKTSSGVVEVLQKKLNLHPLFYVLAVALCTISSNTLASFLSPYALSQGITIVVFGAVAFAYGFARFVGYLLTTNERVRHYLLDPKIRVRNIFALLIMVALSTLLMLVHDTDAILYFLSFALVGLGYSLIYSIAMIAFLAETTKERMGAGAGVFETSIGIGSLSGPVIAGLVSGNSLTLPFTVPSMSAIPILGVLILLYKKSRT